MLIIEHRFIHLGFFFTVELEIFEFISKHVLYHTEKFTLRKTIYINLASTEGHYPMASSASICIKIVKYRPFPNAGF